ncbi:hypothetical protein HPB50_012586 [Hyalomma asiaticum]|uniref:Uncharacterized protein n=1 Tax=Hyalomma asiaticum TaxID=266040 RepID=A0ACB7S0F7_HYAAI|nr:hypothetical protein HPB50_012586 [Hyalomma asiaticum]
MAQAETARLLTARHIAAAFGERDRRRAVTEVRDLGDGTNGKLVLSDPVAYRQRYTADKQPSVGGNPPRDSIKVVYGEESPSGVAYDDAEEKTETLYQGTTVRKTRGAHETTSFMFASRGGTGGCMLDEQERVGSCVQVLERCSDPDIQDRVLKRAHRVASRLDLLAIG